MSPFLVEKCHLTQPQLTTVVLAWVFQLLIQFCKIIPSCMLQCHDGPISFGGSRWKSDRSTRTLSLLDSCSYTLFLGFWYILVSGLCRWVQFHQFISHYLSGHFICSSRNGYCILVRIVKTWPESLAYLGLAISLFSSLQCVYFHNNLALLLALAWPFLAYHPFSSLMSLLIGSWIIQRAFFKLFHLLLVLP